LYILGLGSGKQSDLINELRWRGCWRRRKIKIKGNMSRNVQFSEAEPTVSGKYICVYVNWNVNSNSPISFSPVSSIPMEASGTISALGSASEVLHP
jgi:hypothetical protein